MATIDATPGAAGSGDDTFTANNTTARENWEIKPTSLPAGYTYKIHTQVGSGPVTPTTLVLNQSFSPAPAGTSFNAFVTYQADGSTDEIQFTHAIPATTGASVIGWTPGEGMAKAPQPTITITITGGLGGEV
jgi:hypothetical protein